MPKNETPIPNLRTQELIELGLHREQKSQNEIKIKSQLSQLIQDITNQIEQNKDQAAQIIKDAEQQIKEATIQQAQSSWWSAADGYGNYLALAQQHNVKLESPPSAILARIIPEETINKICKYIKETSTQTQARGKKDQKDSIQNAIEKALKESLDNNGESEIEEHLQKQIQTIAYACKIMLHESGILIRVGRQEKYKLSDAASKARVIGSEDIITAVQAHEILGPDNPSTTKLSLDEAVEYYEQFQKSIQKTKLTLGEGKNKQKILCLDQILVGHYLCDPGFIWQIAQYYQEKTPENRPDIVMMSGVMFGTFMNRQTSWKAAYAPGLETADAQFHLAKQIIDLFLNLGATVIYNLSDNEVGEKGIAHDMATTYMRVLKNAGRSVRKGMIGESYWEHNTTIADPRFQTLKRYCISAIIPYCLRAGRDLLNSKQVEEKTNGEFRRDEFFLLYEALSLHREGKEIPEQYWQVIDKKAFMEIGGASEEKDKLHILCDGMIELKLDGMDTSHVIEDWRRAGFSDLVTQYQSPHKAVMEMLRWHISGPGTIITRGQGLPLVLTTGQHRVTILPPVLLKSAEHFNSNGMYGYVPEGVFRRNRVRRIPSPQGAIEETVRADGARIYKIITPRFLDIRNMDEERVLVFVISDQQIGSDSERPDIEVSRWAIIQKAIMRGYKVFIYINGDWVQGNNYRGKQNLETKGEHKVDYQVRFFLELLNAIWDPQYFSDSDAEKIRQALQAGRVHVRISFGNHDVVPTLMQHHIIIGMKSIALQLNNIFRQWGVSNPNDFIKECLGVQTNTGSNYFDSDVHEEVAKGHLIAVRHQLFVPRTKGGNEPPEIQHFLYSAGRGGLDWGMVLRVVGHWHRLGLGWAARYLKNYEETYLVVVVSSAAGRTDYEDKRGIGGGSPGFERIALAGRETPEVCHYPSDVLLYIEHDGFFNTETLRRINPAFVDDPGFNPLRDGYYQYTKPGERPIYGARQKALHDLRERINNHSIPGMQHAQLGIGEPRRIYAPPWIE